VIKPGPGACAAGHHPHNACGFAPIIGAVGGGGSSWGEGGALRRGATVCSRSPRPESAANDLLLLNPRGFRFGDSSSNPNDPNPSLVPKKGGALEEGGTQVGVDFSQGTHRVLLRFFFWTRKNGCHVRLWLGAAVTIAKTEIVWRFRWRSWQSLKGRR